jgi:hypothetical protein
VKTGNLRDNIAIFKRTADGNTAHYAVGVRPIHLTPNRRRSCASSSAQPEPHFDRWRPLLLAVHRVRHFEDGRASVPASCVRVEKAARARNIPQTLADGVEAAAAEARK